MDFSCTEVYKRTTRYLFRNVILSKISRTGVPNVRRSLGFVLALLLTSSSLASDSTSDFRKVLSGQGYFGSAAGESWPYPGGFLVMKKNGGKLTFIDPPSEMKPEDKDVADVTKSFPALEENDKITLSIVLQGLEAIIGGNPGIGLGHSADLKFAQLDAQGSMITYDRADGLVNDETKDEIDFWIKSGHRVFVVGVALSTKNISVSTDTSTNIDATWNGSAASTCSNDDGNKKDNSNGSDNSNPDAKPKANSSKPLGIAGANWSSPLGSLRSSFASTSDVALNQGTSNQGNSSQAGTKPTKPGGDLHFCKQDSNKLNLKTDRPLVFALGAYEVVNTNASARRHLEPVMSVPKNSGPINSVGPPAPDMTPPNVELADSSDPRWGHLSWNDRKSVP
jgi:hypothetical protein